MSECGIHELLDGVADIDWASLRHAYGSAEKVPEWLAGLLNPATALNSLGDLDNAIYHQGGAVYSAAAAAVPFLIRLATHAEVPRRVDILDLLGQFARLQNTMVEPWKSKPEALACRSALYGASDVFWVLLDEEDRAIRTGAIQILVEFVDRADGVVEELRRRYAAEADPAMRVEFVWAIGCLTAVLSEGQRLSVRAWLAASMPPPGDPTRLAFLVARRRVHPTATSPDEILTALDGARHPAGYADPVTWIEHELVEERSARLVLARRAIGRAVRTGDVRGMASPGAVMMRWRSATAELVPVIAATLGDRPDIAESALHLLAAAGELSRPYLEDIAANVGQPGRTGALAAWALGRLGDQRAVPTAVRSLRGGPDIYPMGGSYYRDRFYWLHQDPGIADVLSPLWAFGDRIVPAIRHRLRRDHTTPTAHQLGEVVIAYGTRAADAVPEFAAMLGTDRQRAACPVLAALGPAASAARDKLAECATSGGVDGSAAAWALFRVTGDPQPFLDAVDVWGERYDAAAVGRRLADLGPHAIGHLERVESVLREMRPSWANWQSVELARAQFRMTGDPALCLEVFDAALDPLRHGRQLPVVRTVLRYLAELGPTAVHFEPLLRQVIAQEERLAYSGGWRGIAEDDEAVALAIAALDSIAR